MKNNYKMFIIIIDRKEVKMKSVHAELNPGGKPKIDFVSLWLSKSASEYIKVNSVSKKWFLDRLCNM